MSKVKKSVNITFVAAGFVDHVRLELGFVFVRSSLSVQISGGERGRVCSPVRCSQ
jgi:hypothetical protein